MIKKQILDGNVNMIQEMASKLMERKTIKR